MRSNLLFTLHHLLGYVLYSPLCVGTMCVRVQSAAVLTWNHIFILHITARYQISRGSHSSHTLLVSSFAVIYTLYHYLLLHVWYFFSLDDTGHHFLSALPLS